MGIVLLVVALSFASDSLGFKLFIIPIFAVIFVMGIVHEFAWRNEEQYQKRHATAFRDAEALIP